MAETWTRESAVLWRRTSTALVLLKDQSRDHVVLDRTAASLWEALEQPLALDELCDRLAAQYGTTATVIVGDVALALQRLHGLGLVARDGT